MHLNMKLKAAEECVDERPSSIKGVTSVETLRNIKGNLAAKVAGNLNKYKTVTKDKNSSEDGRGELHLETR